MTSYDDRAREIVRDIRPYGEPWDWSYAEALTAAVLRAAAELAREEIRAAAQLVASKPVAGEWLRRDDDWMERRVNGEMVAWVSPRGAWCVTRVQDTKPILESACSTVPIAMLAADAWARDNAHLLDWTLPSAPVQPVAPRELTPAEVEECVPSAPRHDAGTGDEDGVVGRFLAFAACQRDDTDRAICDAFYRAFVRLEDQLDATQRRLQATEDARQRVCFARDRFAEQLEERIAADNRDAQRVATIADEAFGPFPVQTFDENLTAIEHGIFGLRQRIGQLEAEKVAVADVASEGDVEDLLDALENLSADPKDGETWGTRYQTASALHDAWQQERSRRVLAEEDADRWHRLFDEGATLTAEKDASLAAASDHYARAVADADEVRGRLVAELDAARGNAETQRLIRRSVEKQLTAVRDEGMRNYDHAIEQRDAALADVARLKAELVEARGKALEEAEDEIADHACINEGGDIERGMRLALDAVRALAAKGGAT